MIFNESKKKNIQANLSVENYNHPFWEMCFAKEIQSLIQKRTTKQQALFVNG